MTAMTTAINNVTANEIRALNLDEIEAVAGGAKLPAGVRAAVLSLTLWGRRQLIWESGEPIGEIQPPQKTV